MHIHNVTFEVVRRTDGSADFVLHHGGLRLHVELSGSDRRALGRLLLEPLFVCVPAELTPELTPELTEAGE